MYLYLMKCIWPQPWIFVYIRVQYQQSDKPDEEVPLNQAVHAPVHYFFIPVLPIRDEAPAE